MQDPVRADVCGRAGGHCLWTLMASIGLLFLAAQSVVGQQEQNSDQGLSIQRLDEIETILLDDMPRQTVRISLEECISRALQSNLDIRIGGYGPAITMADVVSAEAAFDAVLFGSAQFNNTDRAEIDSGFFNQTQVTPNGTVIKRIPTTPFTRVHDNNYSIGLRKRLSTGAVIQVAEALRRYRDLTNTGDSYYRNPFHEFALQLQFSQPLLRDFGVDVNRASINASRNNYRISQQQFQLVVTQTLMEVEANYWRLVLARQQLSIFQGLLVEAETTLEKLQARTAQDTNTELLNQTNSLLERSRASIITSTNQVVTQQNNLLESLNDPDLSLESNWEIIPLDPPTQIACQIDELEAIQTALQLRPEIIAQRIRLDTAGIALDVAENQVLPRLDLFASQEMTGAGDAEHSAWDQQMTNETIDYTVGVSFEVPIGNRAALAGLNRSRAEQKTEVARLAGIRDQVLSDVRIAISTLELTHREIAARTQAAQAEYNTLQAYRTQTEAETGTTPGFLDRTIRAQERLATALLNLAQTVNRYNLAIMDVQRAQGTLLQYDNVQLAELANTNQ